MLRHMCGQCSERKGEQHPSNPTFSPRVPPLRSVALPLLEWRHHLPYAPRVPGHPRAPPPSCLSTQQSTLSLNRAVAYSTHPHFSWAYVASEPYLLRTTSAVFLNQGERSAVLLLHHIGAHFVYTSSCTLRSAGGSAARRSATVGASAISTVRRRHVRPRASGRQTLAPEWTRSLAAACCLGNVLFQNVFEGRKRKSMVDAC